MYLLEKLSYAGIIGHPTSLVSCFLSPSPGVFWDGTFKQITTIFY
jgi:hypothetical protein